MAAAVGAFSSHHPTPTLHPTTEPHSVTESRQAYERAWMEVMKAFFNESVKATSIGIAALDAGDSITLDELGKLLGKS